MTDKLREAALAVLEWLKDKRLDTWQYMEGSQFYADRDKQVKALEAALAEPAIKESLTVRPWVGLTDEEIDEIGRAVIGFNSLSGWENEFGLTIETKLREKNT